MSWKRSFERGVFFVVGVILVDLRDVGVVIWVSVWACFSGWLSGVEICASESGACSLGRKLRVDLRGEDVTMGVLESTCCASFSTALVLSLLVPRKFFGVFLIGVSFAAGVSAGARISSSFTTSWWSEDAGLGMDGAGVEAMPIETCLDSGLCSLLVSRTLPVSLVMIREGGWTLCGEGAPAETRLESRRPLPGSHALPVSARIPGGIWNPGSPARPV